MGMTNLTIGPWNVLGGLILPSTQGNVFHVKPYSGSNDNDGKSPETAVKTLAKALSLATANQNDIVLLYAESNTAANTTDYQSATLNWNKDAVHLIGVNNGVGISSRSRVAFTSTYNTASNLFTLSANNCLIANVEFFAGVAGTNPTGCFVLSGDRNRIVKSHIAGLGHANNDIAGAFSLKISGDENLIEDCEIGVNTVTLGAAVNAQIYTDSSATRIHFRNCRVRTYTNRATNHIFLRMSAGTMDREVIFEDVLFLNPTYSGSTTMTQAAVIAAGGSPAGGVLLVGKTSVVGATDWNSTDAGNVFGMGTGAITAGSHGLAVAVTR